MEKEFDIEDEQSLAIHDLDTEFDEQAMQAMIGLGLGLEEDEAERMLEDYKLGY